MKLTILDGHAVNPGDLMWDRFSSLADLTVYERTSPDLVAERIGDSDCIFLNKVCITEDILSKCKNLKYIGVLATGYNVVDLEACKKRNITVTNIPSYSTNSVAQHVFALITYFTNHIALHNESVHNGDWIKNPDFCYWKMPLTELSGKTLGILGYGNIGKKVSEIGKVFDMKVICHTRTIKPEMPEPVSLEELFKSSDFLTLHAPLTDQTKNLINETSLKMMKKNVIIINTARGAFIDENAVSKALKSHQIAGYACDVITQEPMNKDCPLIDCPNCVITPHIAWAPLETRTRLQNIAYENLKAWLNGNPVNVVC